MKDLEKEVHVDILLDELSKVTKLRDSNFGNNELYIFDAHEAPNLMKEIGRLREMTFRAAGGGTGKPLDVDNYDTAEKPYKQLIVWEPDGKVIMGGYRYIDCSLLSIKDNTDIQLATQGLFKFSDSFINNYLPHTIELGRSFVRPDFQLTKNPRKAVFVLDNLWDGLGALTIKHPEIRYMFGKVTMYTSYNRKARDLILHFFKTFFPDNDKLVYPVLPVELELAKDELQKYFNHSTYKENYRELSKNVRTLGENIPPLINSYMSLSSTMRTFGTAINNHFGDVEETGILVTLNDIFPEKKERHIDTFKNLQ